MASRSPEATRDGWGHDGEEPNDGPTTNRNHADPATDTPDDRRHHLRARVAELEAELDRRDRRLQRVIDEYEDLLDQRTDDQGRSPGPLARLAAWLTG
jgi:hypothetical protein